MYSARSVLIGIKSSQRETFWAKDVSTATFLRNRLSSTACKNDYTTYQMIYDTVPIMSGLKTFGCKEFFHLGKNWRDQKFSERYVQGIFVEYGAGNLYRFYLPSKMMS